MCGGKTVAIAGVFLMLGRVSLMGASQTRLQSVAITPELPEKFPLNPTIQDSRLIVFCHEGQGKMQESLGECPSCHVKIEHKGLKNTLNYYKPQHKYYIGKFDAEKEAIEKRLAEKFK